MVFQLCIKLSECTQKPDRCDAECYSCRSCFVVDPKGNPRQGHNHNGRDVRLRYEQTESPFESEYQAKP